MAQSVLCNLRPHPQSLGRRNMRSLFAISLSGLAEVEPVDIAVITGDKAVVVVKYSPAPDLISLQIRQ
jgi:hypothetical protein